MSDIYVSAAAAEGGDGSAARPFATIQAAVDAAQPGDTILVGAGEYIENVTFRNSGAEGAPIKLVSADGQGAALIRPADAAADTLEIAGADYIEVSGFVLVGSDDSTRQVVHVHGTDSGTNFASNVVIADCLIERGAGDGIKLSKAEDVTLSGNVITGGGPTEAGIDCVGANRVVIENNTITDSPYIGIMLKGGSTDLILRGNTITGAGHTAIEVGGYTAEQHYPPGFFDSGSQWEAGNVLLDGNTITDSGNAALRVIGAQGVLVSGNTMSGTNAVVKIDDSSLYHETWYATDIGFVGNAIPEGWLIDRSEQAVIWTDAEAGQAYEDWTETTAAVTTVADQAPVSAPDPVEVAPITGTGNSDDLRGTDEADVIEGLGGNDKIEGEKGDDLISGGSGDDTIRGGEGDDTILGDNGRDRLEGENGADMIAGGGGADTLKGADGNDLLQGDDGNDRLEGGDDDDTLEGGDGSDLLRGDNGDDLLDGGESSDTLEGGAGDDTLIASAGSDTLKGGGGADAFVFTADLAFSSERLTDFDARDGDRIVLTGFGELIDSFTDLDTNANGILDNGDALIRVSGGRTYIDLSAQYGDAAGEDVIRIDDDGLDSLAFLFAFG
ncbi:parallel beta-helix repeat protein [Rhodobacter aestuarii]|uniref:Parallel beta-helix repeat (Two copies) n=1 Tax=Rhodobacter aestuarii TaxID=453582 RepID=A0A1N7MU13_9RHOB|nr:right-handed parallel beta-helix repeat-containing protein [Rhodobacter aestuarii]PTV96541.1 parallel beta-helix repeat protein [Rhodobacter aestuarii]SIS89451.1 parallel beta-helix repeat (two copies) [Rhodobacter aestuarii]